jgi:hypothetical protein
LCPRSVQVPTFVLQRAGDCVYQHDICRIGLFDPEMVVGWKSHGAHAPITWRSLPSQTTPCHVDASALNTTKSNTTPCVVSKLS